ncbi:MAG: microbial collagenase [Alteromonadaceae bacterium]|jgi:microbial collagenase
MKKEKILFAGLMLSTSLVFAQAQNNTEKVIPTDLENFSQVAKYQHRLTNTDRRQPKPPRLVPPNEYQRLQEKMSKRQLTEKPSVDSRHKQSKKNKRLQQSKLSSSIAAGCATADDLVTLTGENLLSAIKQGDLVNCLYGLYNNAYAGTDVFSDANLLTVAQAINETLFTFTGSDESGAVELEKLVTYLRAMHWAESSTGRVFQHNYQTILAQAFERYFAGEHFVTFNGDSSRNFMLRFEMLILVNGSKTDRQPFLARFSEALIGYANTVDRANDWGLYYQEQGFTNVLVQFFNANNYEEQALATTLTNNPQIIDNLIKFVSTDGTWLIGHTRQYQWADTISELGRLLKFSGVIANKVRPTIVNILASYSFEGVGSGGWVNAQSMVKFFDSENCSMYGDACSFDLEAHVLEGSYACSNTVKIRYQGDISNNNIMATCQILTAGQEKFHQTFFTNPTTPVADDFNSALEVVVFSSSTEYQNYAGDFFDIDTDNGGMYLEDNPFSETSQARFIAYQATWLSGFVIWNLEHEQYHYLDGRFNKWGSFTDQPENSVWWGEGLAEYLAQPPTNPQALAVAPNNTYSLSELFQTTYANSDASRTYSWGYLATRFMMENHRAEIDNELLPSMRAAKYAVNDGGEPSNEGCEFDWGWQAKPDAEANNWLWLYDDSENGYSGSGYWVWTCGQQNTGEPPIEEPDPNPLPEFTPYQDILDGWGSRFDNEFSEWLSCLVAGEGVCLPTPANLADLDDNSQVDQRDINIFTTLLRQSDDLGLQYDFNNDRAINHRDVKAMMTLCDLPRCAITP